MVVCKIVQSQDEGTCVAIPFVGEGWCQERYPGVKKKKSHVCSVLLLYICSPHIFGNTTRLRWWLYFSVLDMFQSIECLCSCLFNPVQLLTCFTAWLYQSLSISPIWCRISSYGVCVCVCLFNFGGWFIFFYSSDLEPYIYWR